MPRRARHPIRLIARTRGDGLVTWYGRYRDPVSRKYVDVNLTRMGLTTDELRKRWREIKRAALLGETRAAALGETRVDWVEAVRRYNVECLGRALRSRTLDRYERALKDLAAWATARGVLGPADLRAADLWAYRGHALEAFGKVSTARVHLQAVHTALDWWRRAGLIHQVDSDTIADTCGRVRVEGVEVKPLTPAEVATLLGAMADRFAADPRAAALVALVLLCGCRVGELEALAVEDLSLDTTPPSFRLGAWVKTGKPRTVDLTVSPIAVGLLRALVARKRDYVLGDDEPLTRRHSRWWMDNCQPLARPWTYRLLRATCGSFLANAPGIWGAASAFRTAKQLGHSVTVSEKFYLGLCPGIPPEARTVETAMQAEGAFGRVLAKIRGGA
jgi:integrase